MYRLTRPIARHGLVHVAKWRGGEQALARRCVQRHSTAGDFAWRDALPLHAPLAPLLASGLAVTCLAEAREDAAQTSGCVSEKETGVEFPSHLSSRQQRLSGVGVRLMGGLVKVYAIGVYLDSEGTKLQLEKWRGFCREEIGASDELWETVCSAPGRLPRTFRMVVVRQVAGSHMQKGFERGLAARVKRAARRGGCKPKQAQLALGKFCKMFAGVGTMKVGSEVRIGIDGEEVRVWIDGRVMGTVESAQLAWALLDMFLGSDSVTPSLRASTCEGLEKILNA